MPTVTIRGVELARRGTWAASTGMVTVDDALLSDAVAAAHDPEVDHAPIKFGHIDPRFDGEPAVGWLANMRVEGGTLVADLEDVPAGLAEVLPTAFRRRSVEIAYNVRTPGGKHYKAVITGLALLGVTPPAVKGLADIQALYAEPRRVAAAAALTADSTGALLIADTPTELDAARRAVAALAEAAGANPTARQALDDALTGLGGAAVAGIHHSPGSPGEHVAQHAPPPGGPRVPVTEQRIRELMALEEGADVEAAIQALVAAGGTPTPPAPTPAPPATPPAAVAPGTPAPTPAATAPPATPAVAPAPVAPTAEAPAPAAPAAPAPAGELVGAGTVTLSAAQWADIQTLLGTVTADRRTGAVDKALAEGRIHPSERDAYLAAMTTNEAGTLELLGKLAANKFPVVALGSSDPATVALASGNEAEWLDFGASIGVPGLGVVPTTPAPTS